jgi:hypothetical protein
VGPRPYLIIYHDALGRFANLVSLRILSHINSMFVENTKYEIRDR